jgi:hypothetical protein
MDMFASVSSCAAPSLRGDGHCTEQTGLDARGSNCAPAICATVAADDTSASLRRIKHHTKQRLPGADPHWEAQWGSGHDHWGRKGNIRGAAGSRSCGLFSGGVCNNVEEAGVVPDRAAGGACGGPIRSESPGWCTQVVSICSNAEEAPLMQPERKTRFIIKCQGDELEEDLPPCSGRTSPHAAPPLSAAGPKKSVQWNEHLASILECRRFRMKDGSYCSSTDNSSTDEDTDPLERRPRLPAARHHCHPASSSPASQASVRFSAASAREQRDMFRDMFQPSAPSHSPLPAERVPP